MTTLVSSEHVKVYVAHTAKPNPSSYKDQAVLDRLLASVGDCFITEISLFHIERWKRERADEERPEPTRRSPLEPITRSENWLFGPRRPRCGTVRGNVRRDTPAVTMRIVIVPMLRTDHLLRFVYGSASTP